MKSFWKYRSLYLMFLPVSLYFVLFLYYPFFKGILLSVQANRLIGDRPFVGWDNYTEVLADPDFFRALGNTLVIGLSDLVLYFVLSLLLALAVTEVKRRTLRNAVQTVVYLPFLFSWAVIAGIWTLVFDQQGIVNTAVGMTGQGPVPFLTEGDYARPLVIGMGVWRSVGYFAVFFLVTIVEIDPTLFEAARIDGASRLQQISRITIPSLLPTMKVVAVLLATGVLTHFDEMYVMQNPVNKNEIGSLLLYVFEMGIIKFKAGFATAGATLVMVGTVVLVTLIRRTVRYDQS